MEKSGPAIGGACREPPIVTHGRGHPAEATAGGVWVCDNGAVSQSCHERCLECRLSPLFNREDQP